MAGKGSISKQQSATASSTAADVVRHDDARLAGGVVAHASTHASAGSDPVTPAAIGAVAKAGDTMTGDLIVQGTGKAYRLRRSGSALDLEGGGASLFFSMWTGGDFTGTQNNVFTADTDGTITISKALVVPTPTAANHAASKGYVDGKAPLTHASSHAPGGSDDLSASFIPLAQKGASNGVPALSGNVLPRSYLQYANTTQDGSIVLAGDLGGTATSPTVPGLATKAPLYKAVSTKTAAYTIVDTDGIILANTSSAGFTVTLPTAVGRTGKSFTIKKLGGNPLAIASNGGTIDGSATENLSASMAYRELTSDGTNWFITSGRADPVVVSGLTVANGATLTLDSAAGHVYRVTANGAAWTLAAPSNPVDSDVMNIEVLASVATTMTINSAILLTTGITATIDIASGKRWFGGLRYVTGVGWFILASTLQA